ncbi:cmaU protein [Xenorhabdus thuongxuanensis]|uniref:CmaU protein n=2 Tax=Xenorhabdus thuongxuanensis TaxID=1873484 RepID=A0A1Q5U164_9GAMM|nr:cmaU protein [Xenorhabdus thuongxuanensis]
MMPGPTNTLLLSSGAAVGFFKTQKLVMAELFAYLLSISIWGFFLQKFTYNTVGITNFLKLIAACYIFWVSFKIWKFKEKQNEEVLVKSKNIFIITVLNPKSFVFASYVMPHETFTHITMYFPSIFSFIAILLPASFTWCLLGNSFCRDNKNNSKHRLSENLVFRIASLILLIFSSLMIYNAIHQLILFFW